MKLSRTTVCSKFDIRSPRWKKRTVGLAAHKISTHNEVDIHASNSAGERYFPLTYYISGEKAKTYETQTVNGTKLYLVPIEEMEVLERE